MRITKTKSRHNAYRQCWSTKCLDKAPIKLHPVVDVAVSLIFSLKKPDNLSGHFNPHFVGEVKHIMPRFAASPLIPAVGFKCSLEPVYQPLAGPGTVQVEPGHAQATVLPVLLVDPLIQLEEFFLSVPVIRGRGAIIREPDHFGGVDERGNTKLVNKAWVESILVLNLFPELPDLLLHGVKIPTFNEVVQSGHQQYPHWAPLAMIVCLPGMQEIRYSGTWYGYPVHMKCVRWAGDTLFFRLVKVMKLTCGDTDI